MRKGLLLAALCLFISTVHGQTLSGGDFISLLSFPKQKVGNYLSRNNYASAGKDSWNDTAVTRYNYRRRRVSKDEKPDSTIRAVFYADTKDPCVIYQTSSADEFLGLINDFKRKGFFCISNADSFENKTTLWQHDDLTVKTFFSVTDSIKYYNLLVKKKIFPKPEDMNYADDLLTFTSHEYLVYYFGEKNVKNDIYYFSGADIARCSVLFLNTSRQVVFIWKDEGNKSQTDRLLFGGQLRLESSRQNDNPIAQNDWRFKSGIHPGMSLFELRQLNKNNFKFYGGKSAWSGGVLPDTTGVINFKKEGIILGCMNCKDDQFTSSSIIDADDALAEERILFVLSVILSPSTTGDL